MTLFIISKCCLSNMQIIYSNSLSPCFHCTGSKVVMNIFPVKQLQKVTKCLTSCVGYKNITNFNRITPQVLPEDTFVSLLVPNYIRWLLWCWFWIFTLLSCFRDARPFVLDLSLFLFFTVHFNKFLSYCPSNEQKNQNICKEKFKENIIIDKISLTSFSNYYC